MTIKQGAVSAGILFLLACFIFVTRAHFIALPLDRDEGAYAYVAAGANEGLMPYRDIFDHKPPFVYLVYQAGFGIFGVNYTAVRGIAVLWVILSMLAIYAALRKAAGEAAGIFAAIFYSFLQQSVMLQGINANAELFTHLPAALSLYFFLKAGRTGYFLSGLMCAAAVLFKPFLIMITPFFAAYVLLKERDIKAALMMAMGFFALTAFVSAVYIILGAGPAMYQALIAYNSAYSIAAGKIVTYVKSNALFFISETSGALALCVICAAGFSQNRARAAVSLFFLALLIPPVLIYRGIYAHYFVAVFPGLCAAAGLTAAIFLEKKKTAGIIAAAAVLLPLIAINAPFYLMKINEVSARQNMTNRYNETAVISEMISRVKKSNETLFVWQAEPQVYFLTGMKAPAGIPYYFNHDHLIRPRDGERLFREISENPRNFLVLDRYAALSGMDAMLASGYIKIMATKNFDVYYANIAK